MKIAKGEKKKYSFFFFLMFSPFVMKDCMLSQNFRITLSEGKKKKIYIYIYTHPSFRAQSTIKMYLCKISVSFIKLFNKPQSLKIMYLSPYFRQKKKKCFRAKFATAIVVNVTFKLMPQYQNFAPVISETVLYSTLWLISVLHQTSPPAKSLCHPR